MGCCISTAIGLSWTENSYGKSVKLCRYKKVLAKNICSTIHGIESGRLILLHANLSFHRITVSQRT